MRCLAGGIKSVIKYRPDTICLSPEMRSRWGSSSWGGWSKPGLLTGWVTANSIYPSRSWLTLGGTARLVLLRLRANAFLPFLINAVQIDVHQCNKFKADFWTRRAEAIGWLRWQGALWGQRRPLPLCTQLLFISQGLSMGPLRVQLYSWYWGYFRHFSSIPLQRTAGCQQRCFYILCSSGQVSTTRPYTAFQKQGIKTAFQYQSMPSSSRLPCCVLYRFVYLHNK